MADIDNQNAQLIGRQGDQTTAVRHRAGAAEEIWVSSMIGRAAQLGDRCPLGKFLESAASPFVHGVPLRKAAVL